MRVFRNAWLARFARKEKISAGASSSNALRALVNIRDDEEDQFKRAARITLALSDEQIRLLIENGQFEEVSQNGQEIPQ
jgi:hypothetical protein